MIKKLIISVYRTIFSHKFWYSFNTHLYKLSLRGLGVLNAEGSKITGEDWLIKQLAENQAVTTVIDVGANLGIYGEEVFTNANIYAFEPHPKLVKRLESGPHRSAVHIIPQAVGAKNTKVKLWDFAPDAELKHTQPTSTLSSVNKAVIEELHGQKAMSYEVEMVTLDSFAREHELEKIDILKIDVEGYELHVLQGAQQLIDAGMVEIIQFEFNEMHAYVGVHFKNFMEVLEDYTLYRLLPSGLLPLSDYRPLTHEIFGFQNIVAIHQNEVERWQKYLPI